MKSSEIRQQFLDFFASKGHQIVSSSSLVPHEDPTLLFTNAGMNQFKDYFLGNRQPEHTRIADTQKCLRVSGKHNDLEEVGVDTYHHTMFEMLGNWSFGDYFKNEAIDWAWELLTEVYKLPKDRLYATVFEGDAKENLPASTIARAKWQELLPEDHIVLGNKKDNFWEMGESGPCGPCSEIYVDRGPEFSTIKNDDPDKVDFEDGNRFMEIWNLVFMEFFKDEHGKFTPLEKKNVDTGAGLERISMVLQGKKNTFETDLFQPILDEVCKLSKVKYSGTTWNETTQEKDKG